ncbi:MAG TPA: PqqD family protein [Vicinamibacterales bacterium]|nr:PqqD family protein [Vicinamibacterales bacterium]
MLVRLTTNRIYELNATGARIWELLTQQKARTEIIDLLEQEFAADRPELESAFEELIASLRAEGLA